MSKKRFEIRCANTVTRKSGALMKCGSFLLEISDDEVRVVCKRCGSLWSIVRDEETKKFRYSQIPKTTALISKKEKKEHGN